MEEKNREWRRKYSQTSQQLEQDVTRYHKEQSRLETLKTLQNAMTDMETVSAV